MKQKERKEEEEENSFPSYSPSAHIPLTSFFDSLF